MSRRRRSLSLTKGRHQYVFSYEDGRVSDLLASFVALAKNNESEFDWFDAAVLSYQVGKQIEPELELVI